MSNKKEEANTIKQLFEVSTAIRIPDYQRAYSWEEKKHCKQFLDDLIEQKGKEYYLGQLLFEVDGDIFFIIDGQQRLTTSVILFSALSAKFKDYDVDITEFENLYLTDKFKTIEEDQILFKKCTRRHITSGATTISQKRILGAYSYFYNNFPNSKEVLLDIKKSLEESLITTFFIYDKVKATQVFEYQNNRGKELSPFEVIKAYLMHQIYLNADNKNSANSVISDIQSIISKIYRNMEATESYFTEIELLNIFCDLYYSIRGNITEVKEKLTKLTNKIKWIISFFEGFEEITDNARLVILSKNDKNISNLFFVGNEADWKIILISIFYKGENDKNDFKIILKSLEILCFKLKLGDFRTDYLPGYAKSYFRNEINFDELLGKIKTSANSGFKYYWNDGSKFENIIVNYFENQNYHYHQSIIKYVLWQYENSIRVENKSGALLDKELYDEYTIEHIAPQTPSKDKYTEDFEKNYLHKAGNLSLLTKSQNSKFNNKPFEDKKLLFQDTALSSYTEIRNNNTWGETEISSRHSNIVRFIKKYFEIPVQIA